LQSVYINLLPDFSRLHNRILEILNDEETKPFDKIFLNPKKYLHPTTTTYFDIKADYYKFDDEISFEMKIESS